MAAHGLSPFPLRPASTLDSTLGHAHTLVVFPIDLSNGSYCVQCRPPTDEILLDLLVV